MECQGVDRGKALTPAQYYNGPFSEELRAFMAQVASRGSVSPAARLAGPKAFSAWDLSTPALWQPIPPQHRIGFLYALAYTVLVDEAMHSHFPEAFRRWRAMTQYPEMFGLWASGWNHVAPTAVFVWENLKAGGLELTEVTGQAPTWAKFMLDDLETSLPALGLPGGDVKSFFRELFADSGVGRGFMGEALFQELRVRVGAG